MCGTKKKGHRPVIVTLDFLGCEQPVEQDVIRIPSLLRFKYKGNYMAIPLRAKKKLQRLIELLNPTIIHVHHPFLLGISALRVARSYNIPILFTYHTRYEAYLHYVPLPRFMSYLLLERRLRYFCKAVDMLIFPSSFLTKQLQDKGISGVHAIIPSAINEQFFIQQKTKSLLHKTTYNLLSVSRFTKEKNIPFLLRVMSMLDPDYYTLHLVGYGSECEALQHYAYSELKLSAKQVMFSVKPSKDKLIELYNNADMFLFASQSETQGIVLAEAMACGLPIIALNAPAQQESIVDGVNGFLVHSEHEMKMTIELLVSDAHLYNATSQKASEMSRTYHPEAFVHAVITAYQALAK